MHVNLWVLPGLLGRHVVYLDVGIHLQALDDTPLTRFCLLLPAGTTAEVTDLSGTFTRLDTSRLIFGERMDVTSRELRFAQGETVPICPISTTETNKDASKSSASFSRWNVHLAHPLAEKGYVRLRFRVRSRGHMLLMRGFGMLASRILVDLRISDPRESAIVPDGAIYEGDLCVIEKLFCFVVLPTRFHTPSVSPPLRYIRMLEGVVWEPYLGRAIYLLRPGKLTVYCWQHLEAVTIDHPFRAFIDVKRDTPVLLPYSFLLTVIALFGTMLLMLSPQVIQHSRLAVAMDAGGRLAGAQLAALGITSAAGAVLWLLRRRTAIRKLRERSGELITVVERVVYRVRMR